MKCSNCGANLNENDKFCNICGIKVIKENNNQSQDNYMYNNYGQQNQQNIGVNNQLNNLEMNSYNTNNYGNINNMNPNNNKKKKTIKACIAIVGIIISLISLLMTIVNVGNRIVDSAQMAGESTTPYNYGGNTSNQATISGIRFIIPSNLTWKYDSSNQYIDFTDNTNIFERILRSNRTTTFWI